MSNKTINPTEKEIAIEKLSQLIQPGDEISYMIRQVSASGIMRRISFFMPQKRDSRYDMAVIKAKGNGLEVICLDYLISNAIGYRQHDKGGIVVKGCGMDMGYHVIYLLGSALWPNGTPKPHGIRNGLPDTAGGYALRYRQL